jgi:hypothetical protein
MIRELPFLVQIVSVVQIKRGIPTWVFLNVGSRCQPQQKPATGLPALKILLTPMKSDSFFNADKSGCSELRDVFQCWSGGGDDFNMKCCEEEAISACAGSARLNIDPLR